MIQAELKELLELQGDAFEKRLQSIKQEYTSIEDKRLISEALLVQMNETKEDMKNISEMLSVKEQMKEITEIVSLAYIADRYFGKTKAWLYQRLNGNKVRGRVYSLNQKEVETLNFALKDISEKIGSLSIKTA